MSTRRFRRTLLVVAALWAVSAACASHADTVAGLRIMLHPYAANWGELPAPVKANLEALAATSLTLSGTTRTGAIEVAFPQPVDEAAAQKMVKSLRVDRSVLWAETLAAGGMVRKAAAADPNGDVQGHRLLVRLKDGVTPSWPDFLERVRKKIGTQVSFERQIAQVSVLSVQSDQSIGTLTDMARIIEDEPEVQYADPVRKARAHAAPNDPFYAQQWGLQGTVAGINVETAWALQASAAGVTVAVVDTGILPHPDLDGRVLPGYDFISDPASARDGDARDSNPRDEGTWNDGSCGPFAEDSFFHGLFVSGLIAANTNNGIGIAGIAADAKILPVRALGRCGEGTFDDILAGMLWASGVNIAGVPPNANPAKIINLSLGGFGPCDQSVQEAVDLALAQGAVVVVSAGNESLDAADVTPANCSGVITVGAHTVAGNLTSYSNFGKRIDLTAPGGDYPLTGLILSLGNDGKTVPANPDYVYAAGTSFSAPMVSGTAALLLARDQLLTSGRILDLVAGSSRVFPKGSVCATVNPICGAGMLDTGAAIGSAIPGTGTPPGAFKVVEYYRSDLDHYFITADPAEANFIDTFLAGTFKRTGLYFYAYLNPAVAPPDAKPVCRFYADASVQINSHYYSANFDECLYVLLNWPGIWNLETANAFYIQTPDANGKCPDKTLPVYRFFDGRRDANHRYTVDLSVRRGMNNRAWVPEGSGAGVTFCSPI